MSKEYEVEFICPQCKQKTCLQEIMADVVQFSNITTIADNGAVNYGPHSCEGGIVEGYECGSCGFLPKDVYGVINDNVALFDWLKDHNCLLIVDQNEQCPEMQRKVKDGT